MIASTATSAAVTAAVAAAKVWSRRPLFSSYTILSSSSTTTFHRRRTISCLSTLTTTEEEYGSRRRIRRRRQRRRIGDTTNIRDYYHNASASSPSLTPVRSNQVLVSATSPNINPLSATNRIPSEQMIQMIPRRSYFGYDGPKRQKQQKQQSQAQSQAQSKQMQKRIQKQPIHSSTITYQKFSNIKDAQHQMQQLLNVLASSSSNNDDVSIFMDNQSILAYTSNFGVADIAAIVQAEPYSGSSSSLSLSSSSPTYLFDKLDQLEKDTDVFHRMLLDAVNDGVLNPSRKHANEISKLVECTLLLYRQIATARVKAMANHSTSPDAKEDDDTTSLSKKCSNILTTLSSTWNLDIHNKHYEHSIVVANCERNWKQAVVWFDCQIDPSLSLGGTGTPTTATTNIIADPHGLYATAMYATSASPSLSSPDDDQSVVVEHVFDAVQRLAMISQHDETAYLLAAGNALGYAGAWKQMVEYLQRNGYDATHSSLDHTFSYYTLERVGLPLVAATMQSCLLCHRPDEAWKIFEQYVLDTDSAKVAAGHGGYGGEWHWGGEKDGMDPLCRDLALRSIAAASTAQDESSGEATEVIPEAPRPSFSELALDLYQQCIDERLTISKEALTSVIEACEQDRKWEEASRIIIAILDNSAVGNEGYGALAPGVIVDGRLLSVNEYEDSDATIPTVPLADLGASLSSAMRACNASSKFGLSLTLLKMFEQKLPKSRRKRGADIKSGDGDQFDSSRIQFMEECISRVLDELDENTREDVLTASMVALCGRRCYQNAINLFNEYRESHEHSETGSSKIVFNYALSNETHRGTTYIGNQWMNAFWHIDRLVEAVHLIGKRKGSQGKHTMNQFEDDLLQQGLSRTLNSCTDAHDPHLSLLLLEWVDKQVFSDGSNLNPGDYTQQGLLDAGRFNDSVNAEIIKSLRWTKDFSSAISLFESTIEKFGDDPDQLKNWRSTIEAGLDVLLANGRGSDALNIFQSIPEDALTTNCFSMIGAYLVKQSQWEQVIDLYRNAIDQGFTSEELGLHALTAVTSTRVENRMRVLRAVVDECAKDAGLDAKTWTETRYWQIKKTLGFNYARLLMWWNDPNRAPVDELILAIKQFKQSQNDDLRPQNDICRAIVAGASLFKSPILSNLEGYFAVPRTADQWTTLLEEVLEETKDTPIRYDPKFVDEMVRAFKMIGRSSECLKYVDAVIHIDGTRIMKKTLHEVLHAARKQHATEMIHNIEMML